MTGLWVALAALALALVVGFWWRARNGRLRRMSGVPVHDTVLSDAVHELGVARGQRAILVQFSTAFCQPCRATRVILGDVAAMVDGVTHVEIDAESHLDLVRKLDIRRTPTVLILDRRGDIRHRAVGQPRKADVIQALGEVID